MEGCELQTGGYRLRGRPPDTGHPSYPHPEEPVVIYDAVTTELGIDPEALPDRSHATFMADHEHDAWLARIDDRLSELRAQAS